MAQKNYEMDGHLCNVGIIRTKINTYILPLDFRDGEEKEVMFQKLRRYAVDVCAEEVILVLNASRQIYSKEGKALSDLEDGVSFLYENRNKSMYMWGTPTDKKLIVGEWEEGDDNLSIIRKHLEGYV